MYFKAFKNHKTVTEIYSGKSSSVIMFKSGSNQDQMLKTRNITESGGWKKKNACVSTNAPIQINKRINSLPKVVIEW
jgi:hypothetical protein